MDNERQSTLVAGEPIDALAQALSQLKWRKRPDGMMHCRARLEPALWNPLARALMRIEAEFLVRDADALGTDGDERRTPDQRRADALVELARRMGRQEVG